MTSTKSTPTQGMSRRSAFIFALAGGAAVGNLYWAQPILGTIADGFGVTPSTAGLLITLTQIGYAIGVFFLVPLGDIANRKIMIPAFMLLAAIMLALSALAPTFPILLITLALVGASTVSGQFLAPLAGDLATDQQRGKIIGIVASGMLLGIMVARAIGGIVTDLIGWRALYGIVAILMVILAIIMFRILPTLPPRTRTPYGALLRSVLRTYLTSAAARWIGLIGAAAMASFTLFWTGLTLLLTTEPFGFTPTQIGLLNLVGILGALAAQQVGRLYDRGLTIPAIGVGLVVAIAAFAITGFAPQSLAAVILSIALYSVGIQGVQVLVQTHMMAVDPTSRSRLNTVFVVGNFIGGTIGSAFAGPLWNAGSWPLIMLSASMMIFLALTIWMFQRRRSLTA